MVMTETKRCSAWKSWRTWPGRVAVHSEARMKLKRSVVWFVGFAGALLGGGQAGTRRYGGKQVVAFWAILNEPPPDRRCWLGGAGV